MASWKCSGCGDKGRLRCSTCNQLLCDSCCTKWRQAALKDGAEWDGTGNVDFDLLDDAKYPAACELICGCWRKVEAASLPDLSLIECLDALKY